MLRESDLDPNKVPKRYPPTVLEDGLCSLFVFVFCFVVPYAEYSRYHFPHQQNYNMQGKHLCFFPSVCHLLTIRTGERSRECWTGPYFWTVCRRVQQLVEYICP